MSDYKKIYKELKDLLSGIELHKNSLKEQENSLRESFAELYGYVNQKTGEVNASKIKAGLMNKAIEYVKSGKNKLEEDLDEMLKYASSIKNKEISEQEINLFLVLNEELKMSKNEFNEAKKRAESDIDIIDLQAILMVIIEELNDYKSSTDKKSNEELLNRVREIKVALKEN